MTARRPAALPYEIVQTSQEPTRFAFVMTDGVSSGGGYRTYAEAESRAETIAQAIRDNMVGARS